MAKIAIVVGHNARAQGAVRVTDGRTEYDWNGALAEMIAALAPGQVRVFRREAGLGYTAEINRCYAEVDAWGADCSIELHFNASAASTASGCEMLSSGTEGSLRLGRLLQAGCLRTLDNRDRGVKVLAATDNGYRSVVAGRAPAILAEPYFGSNADDCWRATDRMRTLAQEILLAAQAFTGSVPAPQPKPAQSPAAALIAFFQNLASLIKRRA